MRWVVALLLLACSAIGSAEVASSVRIAQTDGDVLVRKAGAPGWRTAREGDIVGRGDRVATKDKSAALLLWSNGSMVKLHPESEIALIGVSFDLEQQMEKTLLELVRGRLFVKAQVPEQFFTEFKIEMGAIEAHTQGAEFAIAYDPDRKRFTAWVIFGRIVSDIETWARARVDEGRQITVAAGARLKLDDLKAMDERTRQALIKISTDLGGGLHADEIHAAAGGKLAARIGGVSNRRGNTPYKVNLMALVAGGSGRIKSYNWDFGDGESASGKEVEHTFTMGLYNVVLRAEDENGQKASAQIGILAQRDCGC